MLFLPSWLSDEKKGEKDSGFIADLVVKSKNPVYKEKWNSDIKTDNYLLTTVLFTLKHGKFQMKTGSFPVFSYLALKGIAICHKEKGLLKTQSSGGK